MTKEIYYIYSDLVFDMKHSVKTKSIPKSSTSRVHVVYNSINFLPILYQDFTFIDFGCGLGRPLLIASKFKFCKLIGIDIDDNVHKLAKRNLKKIKNIQLVCDDVLNIDIPNTNIVIYFYRPFNATVMFQIIQKIKALETKVIIIYNNPINNELFNDFIKLENTNSISTHLVIYSNFNI
jgi:SAM-dependent methyltransferase